MDKFLTPKGVVRAGLPKFLLWLLPRKALLKRELPIAVRPKPAPLWLLIRITYGAVPGLVQSELMTSTVLLTSTSPPSGPTRLLWTTAL